MSFSRTSYGNRPKVGVYAYLTASATTTVTTGNTFVPILGTFNNDPFEGFRLGATAIVFDGATCYYKIDWHTTLKSQDAGRTVHVGVAVNGVTLTTSSPSVMGIFVKYAGEAVTLSGTTVIELKEGDAVQLQLTSSTDADQVTIDHFTTIIKRFFN